MKASPGTVLVTVAVAAVVAAVVGALVVLPSPSAARAVRLDERRVEDLKALAQAVDLYWTRNARLPATLDELAAEPGATASVRDPATDEPYALRILDDEAYELCATFERASPDEAAAAGSGNDRAIAFWTHGAGSRCFGLTASPLHPVPPQPGESR